MKSKYSIGLTALLEAVAGSRCRAAAGGARTAATLLVLALGARGGGIRGGGGAAMSGVEGVAGFNLVVMVQPDLLQEQVRSRAHECTRQEFGGDHRLDVAVLGVKPAQEVEDLAWLGHWLADFAELVGELLQAAGVLGDVHITLVDAAEFSFNVDSALQLVVAEQTLDVVPDGEGQGTWLVDDVEDILGDGGLDPVDDAVVNHTPLGVVLRHWRWSGDVRFEPELAEDGVEEASPLTIIGFVHVEKDWNMDADVHRLHHGRRRGLSSREGGKVGGAGGVRRVCRR
jgi:hypothetical protein